MIFDLSDAVCSEASDAIERSADIELHGITDRLQDDDVASLLAILTAGMPPRVDMGMELNEMGMELNETALL